MAEHDPSRRGLLKTTALAAAGLVAGMNWAEPFAGAAKREPLTENPTMEQKITTPQEALEALEAGNRRYMSGQLSCFNANDLARLRKETAEGQQPFAGVLACADSRVPVELIFDRSIGELFVTRVAGNVVSSDIIASLEFGAAVLSTKVILVLGHSGCGAVKAAIAGKQVPGQISTLFPPLQPAVERAGTNVEAAIRANAEIQADLLRKGSPLLSSLIAENKLKIAAGVYDIASGKVSIL